MALLIKKLNNKKVPIIIMTKFKNGGCRFPQQLATHWVKQLSLLYVRNL